MRRKIISILLMIAFMMSLDLTGALLSFADDFNSPWEAPKPKIFMNFVDLNEVKTVRTDKYTTNAIKLPFLWGLQFYQKVISPIDGDKCGMYPTCSGYGVLSVRKHGAVIGMMLTVDRLLHEATEPYRAPLVEKFGVVRYYDPIENNDFWFGKEKSIY